MKSVKWIFALLLAASCGGAEQGEEQVGSTPDSLTRSEVRAIYDLYIKGDDAAYVNTIHSCADKSAEYRAQMGTLMKQHRIEASGKRGTATSYDIRRITTSPNRGYAEAYLNVNYADGSREEIILRFVHVDHRWQLR